MKWYVALGNHDYVGTPDAQIEYHQIDTNWVMPVRYFTFVKKINDSTSLRVVIMDSSPFLKSYAHKFPDISGFDKQNTTSIFYFSDHIHTFQHNQVGGIDYVTTGSTWKSRPATPWFYTKYWEKATGFTICSVTHNHFSFYFINQKGKILYSYERKE